MCIYLGSNLHTSGTIYIYNLQNESIGKYQLGDMYDLPNRIAKTNLLFDKKGNKPCFAKVNLNLGIPANIYIKCKDGTGDIYPFETM